MKRFHVHVSVPDLATGIRFYSALLGAPPTVEKSDYAKWMLDDPRINFAISARGHAAGVNHLGVQVDDDSELAALKAQLDAADASAVVEQTGAACCYARSDKYWISDPAGVAWEAFHTLDSIPVFGEDSAADRRPARAIPIQAACCGPTK